MQIWHFLTVHDIPLSALLNKSVIEKDKRTTGCFLLLALLAKTAKLLPLAAFTGRTHIMSRVEDILKLQAVHPAYNEFRLDSLKQVLLFLNNNAHNTLAIRELKRNGSTQKLRLVLNNRLAHNLLGGNPEEDLTIGILIKIITDIAGLIISSDTGVSLGKTKQDLVTCILEMGVNMAYQHIEVFLCDEAYKTSAKKFSEEFVPILDNRLAKYTSDAAKVQIYKLNLQNKLTN